MHIAMICPDLEGFVTNGGIGTANRHLAILLAREHRVSVLLTKGDDGDARATEIRRDEYMAAGVEVTLLSDQRRSEVLYPDFADVELADAARQWCDAISPDVIVGSDWHGHAAHVAQQVDRPPLVLVAHSPSLWHDLGDGFTTPDDESLARYALERTALAHADCLVSPSRYMLEWMSSHGFALPERRVVLPNPWDSGNLVRPCATDSPRLRGLAFFGRLEWRKGLDQFCDAADDLLARGVQLEEIALLGKPGRMPGVDLAQYVVERFKDWPVLVRLATDLRGTDALQYIKDAQLLAIVASRVDNSPYTVVEAAQAGIPLVASSSGGTAELIRDDLRSAILYDGSTEDLVRLIRNAIESPIRAELAHDIGAIDAAWLDLVATAERIESPHSDMSVTVCLVHHNRPDFLHQAIESLIRQTDSVFDVVVVDDGSTAAALERVLEWQPFFDRLGWTLHMSENRYLGAARNTAVSLSSTDYVLFMDDDNIASPGMIAAFKAKAAATSATLITCGFEVFDDQTGSVEERYCPLPASLALSLERNLIGDANALVRRERFLQAGGFTEDTGMGSEDHELFLRLTVQDPGSVHAIPEPLFRYRRHASSMSAATSRVLNRSRALRGLASVLPAHLHEVALRAAPPALQRRQLRVLAGWGESARMAALSDLLDLDHVAVEGKRDDRLTASRNLAQRVSSGNVDLALEEYAAKGWSPPQVYEVCLLAAGIVSCRNPKCTSDALSFLESVQERARLLWFTSAAEALADVATAFLTVTSDVARSDPWRFALVGMALEAASADYLRHRDDVMEAIRDGSLESALDHYLRYGSAEGNRWASLRRLLTALDGWDAATRDDLWLRGRDHPEVVRLKTLVSTLHAR